MSEHSDRFRRVQERQARRQSVWRSDSFYLDAVIPYLDSESREDFHKALNEPRFSVGSTDASSRVLNHWEAEGIVDDPRPEGQGWRRYSGLEVIWLQAAMRLRRFGLPVQTLIRVRHTMNESWKEYRTDAGSLITLFEVYVLQAMQGVPVFLIVFEDGTADLATDAQYHFTCSLFGLADHIRIEINGIIRDTFPNVEFPTPKYDLRVSLSDDEVKVISALQRGTYSSITLTMRDGQVKTIRTTEEAKDERIVDILKSGNFQDIEIKQRDGNVVSLSRTIIDKL